MSKWRPTRAQFFALGLPAESCTALARAVSIDVPSSTFTLPGHGLSDGDVVRFTATGDGYGTTAALPAPLSSSVLYEARALNGSGDLFRVYSAGSLVELADAGTGVISVVPDHMAKLDTILEHRARWVDDHAIPYTPPATAQNGWPPESFVLAACKLSSLDFAMVARASSPSYTLEDLRAAADKAQAWLDELRRGKPLAVPPVDATPSRAELGARTFPLRSTDRGWKRSEV